MDRFVTIDGDIYNTKLIRSIKMQEINFHTAEGWGSTYNMHICLGETHGTSFTIVTECKANKADVQKEIVAIKAQLEESVRFINVENSIYQVEAIINIVTNGDKVTVHLINGLSVEHPTALFPFHKLQN